MKKKILVIDCLIVQRDNMRWHAGEDVRQDMLKQKAMLIISYTRQTKWPPHSPVSHQSLSSSNFFTIFFNFNPTKHNLFTTYHLPLTTY